jgi:YegS/Rv2252/BmrU family lipid kinase
MEERLSAGPCGRARDAGGHHTGGILRTVPDSPLVRPRALTLSWAALSLLLLGLLALAVHTDWGPLARIDDRGRPAELWATGLGWLVGPLRLVEIVLGTLGMTILTVALAGALLLRGQRRAAAFTLTVMVATAVATAGLKVLVGRVRPDWQDPAAYLSSGAFPSGHASSVTALAGVCVVLAGVFVRRAGLRRPVWLLAAVLVVLTSLDRVLLGRHYPSDVVGGVLLGVALVLLGTVLVPPEPRGHAVAAEPLPEVYTSARRLAVVLNPIKVEDPGQFRALVSAMAADAGWSEPTWRLTTVEDPGTGMAEAAAVEGADLVIVCGGDGTVREVCAELAGTGIPVGIVPAGTGNLLARNLGLPLYIRSAIDVALNGQDRAIDLVEVSGDRIEDTHFMVMAGMGFDAAIMEGVNEGIKKKIGWIAYVLSGLRSLMFPAMRVEVSIDNGEFTRHRARTVVVGNVGYLQAGMPLLPDAAIDDGQLDVVMLHPQRFVSWIPLAFRVLAKAARTDELINRMTGAKVVVRASTDVPRQLDGDSVGPGRELTMQCVHGRLLVRVPR